MQDATVLLELLDQNSFDNALSLVLFQALDDYVDNNATESPFRVIVNSRVEQLTDLSSSNTSHNYDYLFTSSQYKGLLFSDHQPDVLCDLCKTIELIGYKHFGSILDLWARYECYRITGKACLERTKMGLCRDDNAYSGLIIDDISSQTSPVFSPFHDKPMSLAQAVVLSNLALFVIEQKWYEMLLSIDLSSKGQHFVLFFNQEGRHPLLVSSALVQDSHKLEHWLSLTPFFQHSGWQLIANQKACQLIADTGVIPSLPLHGASDLKQFDELCWPNLIEPEKVVEILRLTTAGRPTERMYILYLVQKRIAETFSSQGYKMILTIIDQPWLLLFYQGLSEGAYIHIAKMKINNSNNHTYRGAWLVEEFARQSLKHDFQSYKSIVAQQKQLKVV
ncbi:acyl-homoserine-lactone synthase [Vibrio sonorensis]|uniref:acyl-homoserine-lactone synthase n=1 Tax=Vibrio sonorensis TaxID=1004316 RepID=UPI0008DAFBB7|nr:acyl-homoserine-lactone synthase [Vibrio sonorensis]